MYVQYSNRQWGIEPVIDQKVDLNHNQDASCANMQLSADETELWFTCGNKILAATVKSENTNLSLEFVHNIDIVDDSEGTIGGMICQSGSVWCSVVSGSVHQMIQFDVSRKVVVGRLQVHDAQDSRSNVRVGDCLAVRDVVEEKRKDDAVGDDIELKPYIQCFLIVDHVLWIGTRTGKVLAINVSGSVYGEVLGILSLGEPTTGPLRHYLEGGVQGPVRHLVVAGDDTLIAYQEIKNPHSENDDQKLRRQSATRGRPVSREMSRQDSMFPKYRLVVWDRWDLDRFHWFRQVRDYFKSDL